MLPVPFVGMYYDGIFIVSYLVWILFEVVTGKSRKAKGGAKGKGSWFVFLSRGNDLARDFSGFHVLLWFAAGGNSLMRVPLFFAGITLMWIGIAFRYYCMRVLGRFSRSM